MVRASEAGLASTSPSTQQATVSPSLRGWRLDSVWEMTARTTRRTQPAPPPSPPQRRGGQLRSSAPPARAPRSRARPSNRRVDDATHEQHRAGFYVTKEEEEWLVQLERDVATRRR